jgi:hypothetical protein
MIECAARQTHTARLVFIFDAGCDIDAVAKDIVAVDDDVTDMMPMREMILSVVSPLRSAISS